MAKNLKIWKYLGVDESGMVCLKRADQVNPIYSDLGQISDVLDQYEDGMVDPSEDPWYVSLKAAAEKALNEFHGIRSNYRRTVNNIQPV